MARCARVEELSAQSALLLLLLDCVAMFVLFVDLVLKKRLFGLWSVSLDGLMLALSFGDSAYICFADTFSYFTVTRIYFVITFSDETMNACRNSVWCLQKVFTAISIQALSWFFFSCLCVVLFGQEDDLFIDLPNALVNMFALITTSNNPDVWVHLYSLDRTNVILFMCYLFVSVFFLQNYVAVTIFSEFSQLTNASIYLRQQYRHRSLLMAFEILDTRQRNAVDPSVVHAVLQHMRPKYSKDKIRVLYDCFDPDHEFRAVNFDKFCRIIDALSIRVSTVYPPNGLVWMQNLCSPHSAPYKFVFHMEPVLNIAFVGYMCCRGKAAMVGELAGFTICAALSLTILCLFYLFMDVFSYGFKANFKYVWIYVTVVELVLSLVSAAGSEHTADSIALKLKSFVSSFHSCTVDWVDVGRVCVCRPPASRGSRLARAAGGKLGGCCIGELCRVLGFAAPHRLDDVRPGCCHFTHCEADSSL